MSRLHLVVGSLGDGAVEVEDVEGGRHRASLLAFDGPAPHEGEWVAVHSGYVLERVDATEAAAIADELRRSFGTEREA